MTSDELKAHLNAARAAIPASNVSALIAFDSALMEMCNRAEDALKELARLQAFEKTVRGAVIDLNAPGAIVITAQSAETFEKGLRAAQTSVPTAPPASPPRLSLVKSPEVAP